MFRFEYGVMARNEKARAEMVMQIKNISSKIISADCRRAGHDILTSAFIAF